MTCGQMTRIGARLCQCGASLVRECYWCYCEIPIDQARCEFCGWLDVGHGVVPAIEGRWKTILALLPHKPLFNDDLVDQPFIDLFHSVWDDETDGPCYHARYKELLERWHYLPRCYSEASYHYSNMSLKRSVNRP